MTTIVGSQRGSTTQPSLRAASFTLERPRPTERRPLSWSVERVDLHQERHKASNHDDEDGPRQEHVHIALRESGRRLSRSCGIARAPVLPIANRCLGKCGASSQPREKRRKSRMGSARQRSIARRSSRLAGKISAECFGEKPTPGGVWSRLSDSN